MKILAMDSSGMVASVALMEDDCLLAEYTIDYKKTHSQTLLPMLEEIGKMTELDKTSLDAVAVAGGPGSFTGLRIGSATAKGLGLALKLPLVNVPTLEGMACNFYGASRLICPMMDARRNQVYTGLYGFEQQELKIWEDQMAVSVEEIADRINRTGREVILLGDGADAYRKELEERLQVPYSFAPPHLKRQKASSVAVRAMDYIRMGRTETAVEHRPEYLRVSQAERERREREQKNGMS